MPREYDLVVDTLKTACAAFAGGVTFGKILNIKMPVQGRPNGYPTKIRIAVGPDVVVCQVIQTGRDHEAFRLGADPLLAYVVENMQGWTARPGSCGTSGGKMIWREMAFKSSFSPVVSHNYTDLLSVVADARDACVARRSFSRKKVVRWQSAYMDNGTYPVEWHVYVDKAEIVVRIKNKGSDSEAFRVIVRWVFDHIEAGNTDGRSKKILRGIGYKVFSDTLRIEVPIG